MNRANCSRCSDQRLNPPARATLFREKVAAHLCGGLFRATASSGEASTSRPIRISTAAFKNQRYFSTSMSPSAPALQWDTHELPTSGDGAIKAAAPFGRGCIYQKRRTGTGSSEEKFGGDGGNRIPEPLGQRASYPAAVAPNGPEVHVA